MLNYTLNPTYGFTTASVGWKIIDYLLIKLGPVGLSLEVLKKAFELNLPDITFRYNGYGPELRSEEFYNRFMHEFSHATHYWGLYEQNGAAGSQYWVNESQYTLKQDGYGNRNDDGAERAGVIEAWGFFAGDFSFSQKYRMGIYTNNTRAERLADRAIKRLENHQSSTDISWEIIGKGTDNNYYYGWIPMGFLNDLNDNVETGIHLDNVSGYDVNRIFRSLQNLNNTADDLRTSLINNRPNGVTPDDVKKLATQFGF